MRYDTRNRLSAGRVWSQSGGDDILGSLAARRVPRKDGLQSAICAISAHELMYEAIFGRARARQAAAAGVG